MQIIKYTTIFALALGISDALVTERAVKIDKNVMVNASPPTTRKSLNQTSNY
jgi:hypothetical protein